MSFSEPDSAEPSATERASGPSPRGKESGPSREVLRAIGAQPSSAAETRSRVPRLPLLGAALVVLGAWLLLALWGLGAAPFHTKGEPREALVVWELTHGSSWILPYRNGTELPSKPPLFHWLGALTANARGGLDEWSVRLPSALASLLGSLLVLGTGASLWSVRAGLFAALALLTCFEWGRAATTGRVDMTLTFGLELAFVSLLFFLRRRNPRWLVAFYVGIALSLLGKGPIGIALPAMLTLLVCVLSRDVTPLQQLRLLRGALFVAVAGGGWYALAYWEGGYDFFYKQVLDENVFRFLGSSQLSGGHRHSTASLYALLLAGLLPWTLFLPAVAARVWRERRELNPQHDVGFLLLWFAVVLGFYSIPASKRGVYLLALYPAVALMIGWWLDATLRDSDPAPWLRRLLRPFAALAAPLGVAIGLVSAALAIGLPLDAWLADVLKPRDAAAFAAAAAAIRGNAIVVMASATVIALAGFGLLAAARRPRPALAFACLLAIAAGANVLTRQAILPGVAAAKTQRDLMRAARQIVEPGHTIFFHDTFNYGAIYYWDGHIPVYEGPWPLGAPRYLLIEKRRWERERAAAIHDYAVARGSDGEPLASSSLVLVERRATSSR